MPRVIVLISTLILLPGCAGGMASLPLCPAGSMSPEGKILVGRYDGGDTPAGRQAAFGDALRSGLQELGVQISSELEMIRTEQETSSGGATSVQTAESMKSSLRVVLPQGEVRGVQDSYCRHGDGALGAVAAVPPREWTLVGREHRGAIRVEVDCQSPVPAACDASVLDAIQEITDKAGLKVKGATYVTDAEGFQDPKHTMSLGDAHDVAYVLWVQLVAAVIPGGGADQIFMGTRPSALLQQTRDGVKAQAWTPADPQERYKKGGFVEYDPDHSATTRGSLLQAIRGDDYGEGGMLEGLEAWDHP